VVTGAGSGIGRALAQQLAAAGSALALADIDEAGLLETAQSLEKKRALVTRHMLDVADEAGVRSFAEDVAGRHGRVTLLINNAGVSLHGDFEEISLDDFRWLMNINFWGTVYGNKLLFADTEAGETRAHREPFKRVRINRSGRTGALRGQQVCGARIYGSTPPRTSGQQRWRFLCPPRRH